MIVDYLVQHGFSVPMAGLTLLMGVFGAHALVALTLCAVLEGREARRHRKADAARRALRGATRIVR